MQPVKDWPNGLICYTESDINAREYLIRIISSRLQDSMKNINRKIEFMRVETPSLVPCSIVSAHQEANFSTWQVNNSNSKDIFALRPESTAGTFMMFEHLFPQENILVKRLPLCLWQSGLSFRVEQDKSFSNLRFKQFYQIEFQLAYSEGTKADYHTHAVESIMNILEFLFPLYKKEKSLYSVDLVEFPEEMPFYSEKTTDIYLADVEVVAVSTRTDFRYPVIEISCGLDRLLAFHQQVV